MKLDIKSQLRLLPQSPGVYLFKDARNTVVYVGKATNLKNRVSSYFKKNTNEVKRPIEEAIAVVTDIETVKTGTVIEALILEAQLIKEYWPHFNVLGKDNKTFLYVAITKDEYPKIELIRGNDLEQSGEKSFARVYGPFVSARAIREALRIMRRLFPYSSCNPPAEGKVGKACFNKHIGLCPGVCDGSITPTAYKKNIRHLVQFFEGKRVDILKELKKEMAVAAKLENFEEAAHVRNKIEHLEHIQDVSVITQDHDETVNHPLFARVEGYDISNISGVHAVGSMVVFIDGEKASSHYRKFSIKTVEGANDVAMMDEVLSRRFTHLDWGMPTLLLMDGGLPQVNRAQSVLERMGIDVPIIGLAKGPTRKKIEFVVATKKASERQKLIQLARLHEHILVAVRDESHRFAKNFYQQKHRKSLLGG